MRESYWMLNDTCYRYALASRHTPDSDSSEKVRNTIDRYSLIGVAVDGVRLDFYPILGFAKVQYRALQTMT